MDKIFRTLVSGTFAGLIIGIMALVNMSLPADMSVLGAVIFPMGIITIGASGLYLFTARAPIANTTDKIRLLIPGFIGNLIGAFSVAVIAPPLALERATTLVNARLELAPITLVGLSILTGMLLTIGIYLISHCEDAIGGMGCGLMVFAFVVIGAPHCIADTAYFGMAGLVPSLSYLGMVSVGNWFGGIVIRIALNNKFLKIPL